MEDIQLKHIVEGALLAAGRPLDIHDLEALFEESQSPGKDAFKAALEEIAVDCEQRGFELKKVKTGYRFQVRQQLAGWVNRLWDERPQRYSRAMLETLALIAYRQPITRGDIEEIRGVSVSSQIVKTLLEREWIRVVGHRDVPGRPALFATTRQFLDYFNLSSLEQLPALGELRDLDDLDPELEQAISEAQSVDGTAPAATGNPVDGTAETGGDLSVETNSSELDSSAERTSGDDRFSGANPELIESQMGLEGIESTVEKMERR